MKVLVKEDTECYINGTEYKVQKGVQELEDHVAELLLNVGRAEPVEEEKDDNQKER